MKTQKAILFVTLLFRDRRVAALRRNHRSYAWTEALSGMPGGCTPYNGSARKEYLFQASGIWEGRDFTRWSIGKGREICHLGLWKGPTMQRANRRILWPYKVEKWKCIYISQKGCKVIKQVCERVPGWLRWLDPVVTVPSYSEAFWYPHLYFDSKSNI